MKATGCHVFAGGFTMGVMAQMPVDGQLEVHGLGKETVTEQLGLPWHEASDWQGWPSTNSDFLFSNPRCTGFSCMTSGLDETGHGPWSKPTKDIHQTCEYGVANNVPVICWESVQQAYSVGRPLLDYLRDTIFIPKGYRICHLFLNAASFGNAQHRRRYFFLAHKTNLKFNVTPPPLLTHHTTVRDVIMTEEFARYKPIEWKFTKKVRHTPDCYQRCTSHDQAIMPFLRYGECLNRMGNTREEVLRASDHLYDAWLSRNSEMPFSMHCIRRLDPDGACPTLTGSCFQNVHPEQNRTLTIRELARLMGWPSQYTPVGPKPFHEIGKGIVPAIGEWLAKQVRAMCNTEEDLEYVDGHFRQVDHLAPEKVIDLSAMAPARPKRNTYDDTDV